MVNAVRVTGYKTEGSTSGVVPLFFANIMDDQSYEHFRSSVAMQIDRDIVLVVDRSGSMSSSVQANPPLSRWAP